MTAEFPARQRNGIRCIIL